MKQTRQIIQKVRSGDKEAFGELMQMYRRMIYKIIYSNNLNIGDFRLDEDDLFQEGCLALYDSIFSFACSNVSSICTIICLSHQSELNAGVCQIPLSRFFSFCNSMPIRISKKALYISFPASLYTLSKKF